MCVQGVVHSLSEKTDYAKTAVTGLPLLPMVNGRPLPLTTAFSMGMPQAWATVA